MQLFGGKEDSLVWKFSQNGEFNNASAYDLARPEDTSPHSFSGYWLWKFDTIQKIKHFIWLCYHNSILVRQVIATRGISCNTSCPLCQSQEESIVHPLRDCPFALKFWKQLGTPQSLTNFLQLSLLDWIKQNCLCSNQVLVNGFSWNAQFPFAILWKHRNRVVFENAPSNPNLHLMCIQLAWEFFYCVRKGQKSKHYIATLICWHRPNQGWFKLNSDGASQGNPGKAGGSGLILILW